MYNTKTNIEMNEYRMDFYTKYTRVNITKANPTQYKTYNIQHKTYTNHNQTNKRKSRSTTTRTHSLFIF